MVKIIENHIKMDDLGGKPHYFRKHPCGELSSCFQKKGRLLGRLFHDPSTCILSIWIFCWMVKSTNNISLDAFLKRSSKKQLMNQDAKFLHVLSWKIYVNIYFPEGIEHNMFIDIAVQCLQPCIFVIYHSEITTTSHEPKPLQKAV